MGGKMGKICRIDVRVKGAPVEDKEITVEIELDQGDGNAPTDASGAYFRLFSRVHTWGGRAPAASAGGGESMRARRKHTLIAGHVVRGTVPLPKHVAVGNY